MPNSCIKTEISRRIVIAGLIGSTIECFDLYLYALAAATIFPKLFFSHADPHMALLTSFGTLAVGFISRPVGAIIFGHIGDRHGRKPGLVMAMLVMGGSTVCVGLLPQYDSIGIAAPILLTLCRIGQGLGVGGEWIGGVLLLSENAPKERQVWYGVLPSAGLPLGMLLANASLTGMSMVLTEAQFMSWGWRLPFLFAAVLVLLGLYIRISLGETASFIAARHETTARAPALSLLPGHWKPLVLGVALTLGGVVMTSLFTVFVPAWGVQELGLSRQQVLSAQLPGMALMAMTVLASGRLADRFGVRKILFAACLAMAIYALLLSPVSAAGNIWVLGGYLVLGLGLKGLCSGPVNFAAAELFPTMIRYTGASLVIHLGGVIGAGMTPLISMWLAVRFGLPAVGLYAASALLCSCAALAIAGRVLSTHSVAVTAGDLHAEPQPGR